MGRGATRQYTGATLTKDQYDCNVLYENDIKARRVRRVKIPPEKDGETVWAPIDSKFRRKMIRICEAC